MTDAADRGRAEMELRPDDVQHDAILASTTMPVAILDPEELEVYGWESSIWRKIVGYLGF